MERKRINEQSALGAAIDNGQVFWNDKLYQNAQRVRSLVGRKGQSLRKIERTVLKHVQQIKEKSSEIYPPLIITTNTSIESEQGVVKLINGNSLAKGNDLGGIMLNGKLLPVLEAGKSVTLFVTEEGDWYTA